MAKIHFEYVYLCIWMKRHPKGPLLEGITLEESNFINWGQICAFLSNYSLYFHFLDTLYGENTLWICLSMYMDEKAPKRPPPRRNKITGKQLYQLRSNMCIFIQLFIVFQFFGHPVWLKYTLNMFIYVFEWKGTQKAPA